MLSKPAAFLAELFDKKTLTSKLYDHISDLKNPQISHSLTTAKHVLGWRVVNLLLFNNITQNQLQNQDPHNRGVAEWIAGV